MHSDELVLLCNIHLFACQGFILDMGEVSIFVRTVAELSGTVADHALTNEKKNLQKSPGKALCLCFASSVFGSRLVLSHAQL